MEIYQTVCCHMLVIFVITVSETRILQDTMCFCYGEISLF
jgi:hypothetical protein